MERKKSRAQERKILGQAGETVAAEFLKQAGYEILDVNFRTPYGEIDIISKEDGVLVLVEVKTRTGKQILEIERTINRSKINRILKSAEIYMDTKCVQFSEIRIDAIFIRYEGKSPSVNHIKNYG